MPYRFHAETENPGDRKVGTGPGYRQVLCSQPGLQPKKCGNRLFMKGACRYFAAVHCHPVELSGKVEGIDPVKP